MPKGWQSRVVRISNANTAGTTGLCLEVHDLAISKYAAGREKDLDFTRELARHGMTNERVLLERLAATDLAKPLRTLIVGRINADSAVRKSSR